MAFTNSYNAGITRREIGFNHCFLIGMWGGMGIAGKQSCS